MISIELSSHSEEETTHYAAELAGVVKEGMVIALSGELGAGKSLFARAMIRALGVVDDYITSPTFTLINLYPEGRIPVYHMDLYRLSHPDELYAIGAEEYLAGVSGLALVEWPERGEGWLPEDRLNIRLVYGEPPISAREIGLEALGPRSAGILHEYRQRIA